MADIIVIYWNYISPLRKSELHVVAYFNIWDLGEGGYEKYSEVFGTKSSLHLTRSALCV
jgi:hypothetical protein